MERLTVNLSGNTRIETIGNAQFLVAPLTMIVPGVLNGSQGPLLYSIELLRKQPQVWNGIPIVVNHPPVSARDPKIIDQRGIGTIYAANTNGALTAEGWFNIDALNRINTSILNKLRNGEKIELSTGLLTQVDKAPDGATHNGQEYIATVVDYTPDHLAILTDSKGACSLDDGCGVLNEEDQTALWKGAGELLRELKPLHNEVNEMPLTKEARTELVQFITNNCDCWESEDEKILNGFGDEKLTKLKERIEKHKELETANAKKSEKNAEDEEDEKRKVPFMVGDKKSKNKDDVKKNKDDVKNDDAPAPAPALTQEQIEDLEFARNERNRQKQVILNALVGVMQGSEDEKKEAFSAYREMSLPELQRMHKLFVKETSNEPELPSYFGAATPAHNIAQEEKPEPLGLPVWNFEA